MAKATGFLEIDREETKSILPEDRVKNFKEFILPSSDKRVSQQASRCMDCGIPFCHNGCPVNNIIPEWNNLVYESDWEMALDVFTLQTIFLNLLGEYVQRPVNLPVP